MPYRVRARRAKATRYRLIDVMLGGQPVTADAWRALRDDLLRVYADRLEIIEELWSYEPGVPAWLRSVPDRSDPRFVWSEDDAARREREAAETAYAAVIAGRRDWLRDNGYPVHDPVPRREQHG